MEIGDGYIPDLIVMDAEVLAEARVDRDPKVCDVTSYANLDTRAGTYVALRTWGFGETGRLPHPFGFEISTEHWDD